MSTAGFDRSLLLIAPDLCGPPTGGTLYNAGLCAALRARELRCVQRELGPDALAAIEAQPRPDYIVLDSLYLDAARELRARMGASQSKLILLLHYLPSFVRLGEVPATREALSAHERLALEAADAWLVTSTFMRGALEQLGYSDRPRLCVEPGLPELPLAEPRAAGPLRASMLCSVIPGKGVHELLTALASALDASDRFELNIAGRVDADPTYAASCRTLLSAAPVLAARLVWRGTLPHPEALALLANSDVFVSSSRMESYGMALAEARALGVPIVAASGGHIAAHVDRAAGGSLAEGAAGVAHELLALARNPQALAARRKRALAARTARPWNTAASELLTQLLQL